MLFQQDDFINKWKNDKSKDKSSIDIFTHFHRILQHDLHRDTTRMLDFGCGSGDVCILFAPLVKTLYGVDPSDKMLSLFNEQVSSNNIENAFTECVDLLDDNSHIPFNQQRFHVIISSRVFIFIENVQKAFQILYDLLEPNGIFVCTELKHCDIASHFFSEQTKKELFHLGVTHEQLQQWLSNAGFIDIKFEEWNNEKESRVTKQSMHFPFVLCYARKPNNNN
jgi:ubiquinone/menaquinone biosynthesis C-methylase UbiE